MSITREDIQTMQGPPQYAVTRIGRSGTKLHPVVKRVWSSHWDLICECTGSNNGHWQRHAMIFGGSPTCKTAKRTW